MERFESSYKMPEWLQDALREHFKNKNVYGIKRITETILEIIND